MAKPAGSVRTNGSYAKVQDGVTRRSASVENRELKSGGGVNDRPAGVTKGFLIKGGENVDESKRNWNPEGATGKLTAISLGTVTTQNIYTPPGAPEQFGIVSHDIHAKGALRLPTMVHAVKQPDGKYTLVNRYAAGRETSGPAKGAFKQVGQEKVIAKNLKTKYDVVAKVTKIMKTGTIDEGGQIFW